MVVPAAACIRVLMCAVPFSVIAAAASGAAAAQDPRDERASALAIQAGRDTFRQFCAPCHGVDGKGHGPVAPVLTTPPTDLTSVKRRNMGVFPLATLEAMLTAATRLQTAAHPMAHGSEQMPIWGPTFLAIDNGPTLARARVANLLAYLESTQQ
ncbi:MAG: c-type cytochrome [Acidobacteria bacterium]|nr:c-type cytochrome [Acidobacteriota bacterium]